MLKPHTPHAALLENAASGKTYGGKSRCKPVSQLSADGRLITRYESIAEASRQTGFGEKEIINVAKGRYQTWKGFRWRYA